jgi:hypothetical protein
MQYDNTGHALEVDAGGKVVAEGEMTTTATHRHLH